MKAEYCLFRSSTGFKENTRLWQTEKLRKYVKLVQEVFEPCISEQAEELFKAYFTFIKHSPIAGKERKTVRMLESIIRLGQAHARLMFRDEVTTFDAISVILLIETSLNCGLIKKNFLHARYVDERDYFELKVEILQRLKLVSPRHQKLLWENMKGDIKVRSRTPSPVQDYIEESKMNLAITEFGTEEFSFIGNFDPRGIAAFNITQVHRSVDDNESLVPKVEEVKLGQTTQKAPSIGSFDLDEDELDLLDQFIESRNSKHAKESEVGLSEINEDSEFDLSNIDFE